MLIYVNNICDSFPVPDPTPDIPDPLPDASLLMDDVAAWVSGEDPLAVVETLNSRLREIYEWSI